MTLPHMILSLSNELLIEIVSYLCPSDIYACQCTCHRLNSVIINSNLIQYLMRTALSGVFDPLEPGPSLPDRLDALERWEAAWMKMDLREPNAIINAPVFDSTYDPIQGVIYGQYLIMVYVRIAASASYSFLDVRAMSLYNSAARWTIIEVDTPTLVFTFAPELNLTVTISRPTFVDDLKTTVTMSFLQFSTGELHPLASQPKLEVSVSGSTAPNLSGTAVIGDYILYRTGSPPAASVHYSICAIYLIAWKEGWVTQLRISPPAEYSQVLSVISEDIILLVRLREPALELCRLSNIDDREKASLETVRTLYMPVLAAGTSLFWAFCPVGHPVDMLFSKTHQRQPSSPHLSCSSLSEGTRIDPRRHLHSVPMDGIIVVLMRLTTLSDHVRMFGLAVRRRTLLEFSKVPPQAGAAGTGTGSGSGMAVGVPWEKWGPNKTRILEHDTSFWPGGSLAAGERCAMVLRSHITIQDYNLFRVQRALKLFGGVKEVTLESGSVVKVVKEPSVHLAGEWFRDDIETSLPYFETAAPYNWCNDILIHKDNLIVVPRLDRTEAFSKTKFHLYSL